MPSAARIPQPAGPGGGSCRLQLGCRSGSMKTTSPPADSFDGPPCADRGSLPRRFRRRPTTVARSVPASGCRPSCGRLDIWSPIRVAYESPIRVASESPIPVASESTIRAIYSSRLSESPIRVAYPSRLSGSPLRLLCPQTLLQVRSPPPPRPPPPTHPPQPPAGCGPPRASSPTARGTA